MSGVNHGMFSACLKGNKRDYRVYDVRVTKERVESGGLAGEREVIKFLVCVDGEFDYLPSSLFTHSNWGRND